MRISLLPSRRAQRKRPPGKLNIALLSLPANKLHFSNELAQRLDNLPVAAAAATTTEEKTSVENPWYQLRDTVQETTLAALGRARRQHHDYFDENDASISNLLAEENRLHKLYVNRPNDDNKAAFYGNRRLVQPRLREMQDAWTASKAEEIQGYVDSNQWKSFFSAIKAVYGPPTKSTAPLLSFDGSILLTEKTSIRQRWTGHFRGVLNRISTISDAAIARLPQAVTNVDLDLRPLYTKQSRPCSSSPAGKRPDRTRSLQRSTGTVALNSWIIWRRSSRRCGVKAKSPRISKTPQSCIYTSGKETAKSATITEASPY
ncbi:hypothetical protein SprV_0200841500 [Sparganum proliferum]